MFVSYQVKVEEMVQRHIISTVTLDFFRSFVTSLLNSDKRLFRKRLTVRLFVVWVVSSVPKPISAAQS